MCMLLHRYTVFVILFANGIPFYNSGLVFDHIAVSIYALQCYMYLSKLTVCCHGRSPTLLSAYIVYNSFILVNYLCLTFCE